MNSYNFVGKFTCLSDGAVWQFYDVPVKAGLISITFLRTDQRGGLLTSMQYSNSYIWTFIKVNLDEFA